MSGDLKMPFCLAVALHAGAAGAMALRPAPPGDSGDAARTSVIGVVTLPGTVAPPPAAQIEQRAEPEDVATEEESTDRIPEQPDVDPASEVAEGPLFEEIMEAGLDTGADAVVSTTPPPVMPPELVPPAPDCSEAPPGTPETPGAAEITARDSSNVRTAYLVSVAARLHAAKRYPADARRFGVEGTAVLSFRVRADGAADDVSVVRSSGVRELDGEAVAMVRRASPFGPIPVELDETVLRISVPVAFRIRE